MNVSGSKGTVVVAIGGNSIIRSKDAQSVPAQWSAIRETCQHIADLIADGWRVVITHGNGPQVGFILLRSEMSRGKLHDVPLDSCGADTQGAIGYQIQQCLGNELLKRGLKRQVVTVVTQSVVDPDDPAFENPTKPIGSFYSHGDALLRMHNEGWDMVEDSGRGWRRVVASPRPLEIVERDAIRTLVEAGFIVIAAGGGGIPVTRYSDGRLSGRAAVIDKDFGSALLAHNIGADTFLVQTGVEKVCIDYGKPTEQAFDRLTVSEAWKFVRAGQFPEGSMGPKVQACIQFLDWGGKRAVITSLEKMNESLDGRAGTTLVAD